MTVNRSSKRADPPTSEPVPLSPAPMSPLPETIVHSSDVTAASSVSHSILSDYATLRLPATQRPPVQVTPFAVTPKVSNQYSAPKRSTRRDLHRSPHLQEAMERINRRRSEESQEARPRTHASRSKGSHEALEVINRLRPGGSPAQPEQIQTSDVGVLLELFSRYDSILDHLVKKNRKLRAYVKGKSDEYPSELSLSSHEVLQTLDELRRRGRLVQEPKTQPDHTLGNLDMGVSPGASLGTDISIADSNTNISVDLSQAFSTHDDHEFRSRLEAYASKRRSMSQQEHPKLSGIVKNTRAQSMYTLALNSSIDPPSSRDETSTRVRLDPAGSKDPDETSVESGPRGKPYLSLGRYGEPQPEELPTLRDEQDSLQSVNNTQERVQQSVIDLSLPDTSKIQRLRSHRMEMQKRALSRASSARPTSIKFNLPAQLSEKRETTKAGAERTSSILKKVLSTQKAPSIIIHRKPDAIARNAQRLREARMQRIEKRDESLSPDHTPSHAVPDHHVSIGEGGTLPPNGYSNGYQRQPHPYLPASLTERPTNPIQTGHFLPVSPASPGRRLYSSRQNQVDDHASDIVSFRSSVAPSEKARRLQSQIDEVYAYSQEVRESQDRLKTDLLKIKQRYRQGHEERTRIVDSYKHYGRHQPYIQSADSYDELVNVGSAEGSLGIFEANDGVIHIEEESLPSERNYPADMYRKNDSPYFVEEGVICIDDESLVTKDPSIIMVDTISVDEQTDEHDDTDHNRYSVSSACASNTDMSVNGDSQRYNNEARAIPRSSAAPHLRNSEANGDMPKNSEEPNPPRYSEVSRMTCYTEAPEAEVASPNRDETLAKADSSESIEQLRELPENLVSMTSSISTKGTKGGKKEQVHIENTSFEYYEDDDDYMYYGDDDEDANSVAVVRKDPSGAEAKDVQVVVADKNWDIAPAAMVHWGDQCGAMPCGLMGM